MLVTPRSDRRSNRVQIRSDALMLRKAVTDSSRSIKGGVVGPFVRYAFTDSKNGGCWVKAVMNCGLRRKLPAKISGLWRY